MPQRQSEIVVLKPTNLFLSFLASQLPEANLPSLKLLHTDNTAYVIPKHDSDDGILTRSKSILLQCSDMKFVVGWGVLHIMKLKQVFLIFCVVLNLSYILILF